MEKLHFAQPTPYERVEVDKSLKREIAGIWNSEMIRRSKPTPVDEAKSGLAVVEQVRALCVCVRACIHRQLHTVTHNYTYTKTSSPPDRPTGGGGDG